MFADIAVKKDANANQTVDAPWIFSKFPKNDKNEFFWISTKEKGNFPCSEAMRPVGHPRAQGYATLSDPFGQN